jgi:hypothetical protein
MRRIRDPIEGKRMGKRQAGDSVDRLRVSRQCIKGGSPYLAVVSCPDFSVTGWGAFWVSDRDSKTQIVGLAIVTEMDPRTMGSMGSPALRMLEARVNGLTTENS